MLPVEINKTYYCERCRKTLRGEEFYTSNNLEKYPNDGKLPQCKKCITAHVDNWNPDTYLWILQEIDVPYIPDEWNKLMQSYMRDNKKITGVTILGRYLSKMKLKQFKEYRWKDNEFLQDMANKKIEEAMKRQGYGAAEIATVIDQATVPLPDKELQEPVYAPEQPQNVEENYFDVVADTFNDDLTDEDRTYLRLKWGKSYKPEEWIKLEQLYEEMMNSYDIQGAGHIDTLKLVCKTSLKANQLIDIGDVEGFQKMQKAYDSLMKSGKFTAAQNKAEQEGFVDSIGELIELCEKEGYIERYYIDQPKDRVDLTIADMQRYTKTLIEEETHLPIMVEKALREINKEDKSNAENVENSIVDDIELTLEDIESELKDKDFVDFEEFLDEEAAADADFLKGGE